MNYHVSTNLFEYRQLKRHQHRIQNETAILLEIILSPLNV